MISVNINPSLYRKLDKQIQKDALAHAISESVKYAESECRRRAPIRTGNLRRSHSFTLSETEGEVTNNCGYAAYVAFGTSRQRAQNYPLSICKDMDKQQLMGRLHKEYLQQHGVVE